MVSSFFEADLRCVGDSGRGVDETGFFFLPSFFEGIFSDLTDRFFLVTWNKRFFGYDRGLFWVFVLGYWSYGEKKFGSWLVFLVTWN
jgi:hypothetical protein